MLTSFLRVCSDRDRQGALCGKIIRIKKIKPPLFRWVYWISTVELPKESSMVEANGQLTINSTPISTVHCISFFLFLNNADSRSLHLGHAQTGSSGADKMQSPFHFNETTVTQWGCKLCQNTGLHWQATCWNVHGIHTVHVYVPGRLLCNVNSTSALFTGCLLRGQNSSYFLFPDVKSGLHALIWPS